MNRSYTTVSVRWLYSLMIPIECSGMTLANLLMMMHIGTQNQSPTNESINQACHQEPNEKFEWTHVALANAFARPWAMMVEVFDAVIAERAVLCEHIFPSDHLADAAVFYLTVQIQTRVG